MNKKIAFIDDETPHIGIYITFLQAACLNVVHYKSPDSCLSDLKKGKSYAIYITDLMMPSYGLYSREESRDYLMTGAMLAKDIRVYDLEAPIIVFTNMNVNAILDKVRLSLDEIANAFLLRKSKYAPDKLAELACAILDKGVSVLERKTILQIFWDSLILEPNVAGLGIDLKKLVE